MENQGLSLTGRLERWAVLGHSLWGEIYDDVHKRFEDGRLIQTSYLVVHPEELYEGLVIESRYSVYLLGEKA